MAAARSFSPAVAGASSEPFSSGSRRRSSTYFSNCCTTSSSNSSANGFPISAKPTLLDRSTVGSRCPFPRCDATSDQEIVAASEAATSTRASSFSALEQLKASAGDRYTRERSSIAVIGLSVHTAPVEMREKLAVPEALWSRATAELCDLHHIEEAAVLSTCNRMEIYVVALSWNRGIREVMAWMSKISGIPVAELRQHLFMLRDGDAIRHLFQVSSGLDSLVLGEGQILAQVKQVVRIGQASGGLGKVVDRLFKDAITAGKRVRSETNISSGAVSVSSAAVELALSKLPRSNALSARMLVVGAGKMGRLVIKHLAAKGCTSVVVVNRSAERVSVLREEMKDEMRVIYKPLTEMHACASEADVIFTSTASEAPLFLRRDVEFLPPASEALGGSRLFVDIAVPRNVGSCVSGAGTARVFNVDDLKEVVEANREDRLRKAAEAQSIIGEELRRFEAWRDSLETVPTIKGLRSYADRIRLAELEKCLQKIGDDDLRKRFRKALDEMSSGIVNKLLHGPLQHLRCDGGDSRDLDEMLENMHALNRMFSLGTEKSVREQKIKSKVEKAQR